MRSASPLEQADVKQNRIDAEATRWVARLQSGALSPDEQHEFEAWTQSDARHQGAFVRAQAVWLDLDRIAALGSHRAEESSRGGGALAGNTGAGRRWFLAAGVGSLTLTALGGAWWWRSRGDVYESDVGEIRRVTLVDGSTMLLNTATRALAHFTATSRDVRLIRGEALFEVVKDLARPFVVHAGDFSVRAVGTAFFVRSIDSKVDVTVSEGVVEVSETGAAGPARKPQRVIANERALETGRGVEVQPAPAADISRRLAWREGLLSFAGEPLSEAVAEVNRHNRRQIRIDDPALATRSVVGLFRTSDSQGFARTVAAALGVESAEGEDGIHLRPRSAP